MKKSRNRKAPKKKPPPLFAVAISSGHGTKIAGASGPEPWGLVEVDEAIDVMERVAYCLRQLNIHVDTFTDTTSTDQQTNLETICNWHNNLPEHAYDISIHFNAYQQTAEPMGTEVCYVTQERFAEDMAAAIAIAGDFPDRSAKYRDELYFLNNTKQPALLLEVCFVDSQSDCLNYDQHFDRICDAIAQCIKAHG